MSRPALYVALNVCFALLVLAGCALSGPAVPVHPVYLIALFALCSSPVLGVRALNDRNGLLVLFGLNYFVLYGLLDFTQLLFARAGAAAQGGVLGTDEAVILTGGVLAFLGYHVSCRLRRAGTPNSDRDWSERNLVMWGTVIWGVSTWIGWQFRVHVLVDNSLETLSRGFGTLSGLQLDAIMIAGYLQPMGIVILAYAYCMHRRPYLLLVLVGAVLVEMIYGVVTDSKGQVLIGIVLIAITKLLADGKIPKAWLAVAAAVVVVVFPILQANRVAMGQRGTDHAQAAQNIVETIQRALAAQASTEAGPDRSETFIERSSLKHSVTMIVDATGRSVAFQNGYTLSPLLTAFIPRIIWPEKLDVPTGRLVNKEFHVSEQEETNISPSHLGELYWNFGWPGVLVGMTLIGLLLGFIAARFDLSQAVTLTRILILIGTVKLLVMGFEGALAVQYSVWMRTMLAIGLLHAVFARAPAISFGRNGKVVPAAGVVLAAGEVPAAGELRPRYPNLLA